MTGKPGQAWPIAYDNRSYVKSMGRGKGSGGGEAYFGRPACFSSPLLYFVGQETGAEDMSDEQLLNKCLENLAPLPGYERIDRAGIIHYQVIRNRSVDKQYFNTEPGIQRFRPHARTSIDGLWLAGDWVRSELDFPCMEAAIRSGLAAADLVLESS